MIHVFRGIHLYTHAPLMVTRYIYCMVYVPYRQYTCICIQLMGTTLHADCDGIWKIHLIRYTCTHILLMVTHTCIVPFGQYICAHTRHITGTTQHVHHDDTSHTSHKVHMNHISLKVPRIHSSRLDAIA